MKLCTFACGEQAHVGLLLPDADMGPDARILDLHAPEAVAALGFPPCCLEEILASHLEAVRSLAGTPPPDAACVPLGSARLLAPLRTRAKVIGVARNFFCALAELKADTPAAPFWFAKMPNTVIGAGDAVRLPPDLGNVTYEGEVGLVIGKKTRAVSREEAVRCIAGYTLINDVSASSLIKNDAGNFFRGKNVDTFCPMGPFFVSADEAPDPHNLRILVEVDGRRLQDGNTRDMVFNMFALVSALSQTMTLEPGDVIAAGTPAGAAAAHTPPAWLRSGQTVRVHVDGFGDLVNPII